MNSHLKVSGIYVYLVLFVCGSLAGQYRGNNSGLNQEEKDELVQLSYELFDKSPEIHFYISTYDLRPDFKHIPDPENYNESHLDSLLKELDKDNSNSAVYMSLAQYYNKTNQTALANSNYQKAYDNLNEKSFEDMAAYYSFRAFLKNILGKPDALEDYKKSLAINANDSLAILMYPINLTANRKYGKAKKVVSNALEKGSGNLMVPYIQLFFNELYETGDETWSQKEKGMNLKKKYGDKNYDEIMDFSLIDKYGKLYENQLEIYWARRLADILGLVFKMVILWPEENHNLEFLFTSDEKKKIENLITEFSSSSGWEAINEYSLSRCLGYLYFMNGEWSNSLDHFNKAIEVFPISKRSDNFNPSDCYNSIIMIHKINADSVNYRKVIHRKIDSEPDRSKSLDDLLLLANDYFQSGKLEEANKLCNEIMLFDSNHFDTLRLKSHLNFLKGENQLTQFYIENAGKHMKHPEDEHTLTMQYAIYLIYDGNAEMAEPVLQSMRSKGHRNCSICDTLIKEYCRG